MTEPERLKEWSHKDEWHGNYSRKGDLLHKSDENKNGCFWGLVKLVLVIVTFAVFFLGIYLMRKHG